VRGKLHSLTFRPTITPSILAARQTRRRGCGRTVYQHEGEGGTLIVPGNRDLCDEHEVVECRDMVAIVRDRIQPIIKQGES